MNSSRGSQNEEVRILLVEDEARVAGFIAKGLREQSYAVDIAAEGEDALYPVSYTHLTLPTIYSV